MTLVHCPVIAPFECHSLLVVNRYIVLYLQFPETRHLVLKHMIHGPCGVENPTAPCMRDGNCSKQYPRPFIEATLMNEDGYPVYRRPNDGTVAEKKNRGKSFFVDNRNVVPHNRQLLLILDCHINVEICSTIKAIKYVFKYITKGPDRAAINIQTEGGRVAVPPRNEIDVSIILSKWRLSLQYV